MKICFVTYSYFPLESGGEKTLRELIEIISSEKNLEITILTRNIQNKLLPYEKKGNVEYVRIKNINRGGLIGRWINSFLLFKSLLRLLYKRGFDLVIINGAEAEGFCSFIACKITAIPAVIMWHSSIYQGKCVNVKCNAIEYLRDKIVYLCRKTVLRNCNSIILKAISKKEFSSFFRIIDEKIIQVSNPILLPELENKIETGNKKFIVLYFGKLNQVKGVDLIPQIGEKVYAKDGEIQIVVAGDGPLRESLQGDNIVVLNHQNNIYRLLRKADVVLLPYRGETCCGHSQIEAMAMGKPVIIKATVSNRLWFTHLYDIFFVENGTPDSFAEAILKLKENPELREKIGRNARKTIEQYWDMKKFAKEFIKSCEKVLESYK